MTEAQRDDLRSYFEDFDGEYYRLTISVAKNENGTMLYNIGKIKKENAAQELPRGVTVSGSLANATSAASKAMITCVDDRVTPHIVTHFGPGASYARPTCVPAAHANYR